ncbi:MAG TPA: CHAD domain-containing protein [Rhizomicrobium sp.]|jgi:CHAD domain-containing protein|nr:CHAD domain-containing protein [Rhizomicrobium sp.]
MEEPQAAIVRNSTRMQALHAPVNARPLRISSGMSVEDAFRVTLLECLAHVAANVAPVTRAREVEGLHQLRVGLRRLAVAFSAFGEEFRTPAQRELQERTKAFSDAIGPARDLDVFAEELFPEPAGLGGDVAAFALLRERLARAREEAWNRAVESVSSVEFAVLLDDVAVAAQSRSWAAGGNLEERLAVRAPVKTVAARMLDEYLIKARKRGRHIRDLAQRDCHRLRIALKKLRYAAEFYGPLYKRKKVRKYISKMKELQDLLGALNDASQVRATLSQLTAADAPNARVQADLFFASGLVNGWHCANAIRLGKSALKDWDRFKHAEPFWS